MSNAANDTECHVRLSSANDQSGQHLLKYNIQRDTYPADKSDE